MANGELWTNKEEEFIRAHWREMTDEEMGAELDRTGHAVQGHRYQVLELSHGKLGAPSLPKGHAAMHRLLKGYKRGARERGLVWELSEEQFLKITQMPCHYCGAEPAQVISKPNCYGDYIYNGIDRVDNQQGYTVENVVPCCQICNKAKRDMLLDDFIEWAIRLHEHLVWEN